MNEEYSLKGQLAWRLAFISVFVVVLLSTIFQIQRVDVISADECLRDYTFIWTESVNRYLASHYDMTNRYIIFCSFLMDFMVVTTFICWLIYWKSYRMIIAVPLFFGARGFI